MKRLLLLVLLLASAQFASAQTPVNFSGTSISESFSTLAASGTSAVVPAGFGFVETGSALDGTYAAGTGSDNTGNTYSFGTGIATERAFGAVQSSAVISTIGVRITNTSGSTLTSLTVGYTGEKWRGGTGSSIDRLDFQYSTGATAIQTGAFLDFNGLDFASPITLGSTVSLDGNALANRTVIAPTILTGVTLAPGATITLRWLDLDASGQDDGLAIDDFSFSATVGEVQTLSNNAGFRLLSVPVLGVTVGDLAALNLVQGIAGQYPLARPNLFLGYTGSTLIGGTENYIAAFDQTQSLTPGVGFFWQFYNTRITTAAANSAGLGSGTSESFVLGTATDLRAAGPRLSGNLILNLAATTDKFYMIGNPFARNLDAVAITVAGGIQGDVFQRFNPATGTYSPVSRTGATAADRALAVWQGFFAETVSPSAPAFLFDFAVAVPATATFVGRSVAESTLALTLTGQTVSGVATRDEASWVRFSERASAGWDALDASKLVPPAGPYALVAPVTTRDGAAYRVAISSLPLASALVPLSIFATDAGTYTLTADRAGLPVGYSVELRDVATGAVSDLSAGYTFTSDATDWADRFVLAIRAGNATAGEETATGEVSLSAPRPNPTSGTSRLILRVPTAETVTATVVDALGRTVATLFDGPAPAGTDVTLSFESFRLAPGAYLVRVAGETFTTSRRLTVVR